LDRCLRGKADVPGEVKYFEQADEEPGDVELPPLEAVAGGGGEGVMIVVPALTETDDAEEGIVAAVIGVLEGAGAPEVADRINGEGGVVHEAHSDQAAPEETHEGGVPGVADGAGDGGGDGQAENDEDPEPAVAGADGVVGQKIGDGAVEVGRRGFKEPAEMGMPHAAEESPESAAVLMGGMGIALTVALLVMAAMEGAPLQHGALEGHGAEADENEANDGIGGEGAVGEEAVVADADSDDGGGVHAEEQIDFHPADAVMPENRHAGNEGEEGNDDTEKNAEALGQGCLEKFVGRVIAEGGEDVQGGLCTAWGGGMQAGWSGRGVYWPADVREFA